MFDTESLKVVARTMAIAILSLTILGLAAWQASEYGDNCVTGYEETNCETIEIGTATSLVCVEDMPCWDCETMGNRICGKPKDDS